MRRASKEPIDKGGWNIFFTWTEAPTAYRKDLKGVIVSPVTFLWNVEKM